MNILAHGYLSGRSDALVVGNFMGDFIKGDPTHPRHNLSPADIAGVRLHRAIDSFTDAHPGVAAVRELVRPRCHKYAGVAVDVFFDHVLAVNFSELTGEKLADFIAYFYATLHRNANRLPPLAVRMLNAMSRYDWLTGYQTLDGINQSLNGIARRTAYPSGLETAVVDLERYHAEIESHFRSFWPQLALQVHQTLASLPAVG